MTMRLLLGLVLLCASAVSIAQSGDKAWQAGLESYWAKIDSAYADTLHSPLPLEERKGFTAFIGSRRT